MTDREHIIVDGRRYLYACRSLDVVERRGFRVEIDIEHDLAIFRVDGVAFCVSNICPHKREAKMYDGFVADGTVTCPFHAWRFDIRTGKNVSGQAGLCVYEVIERASKIYVSVPE